MNSEAVALGALRHVQAPGAFLELAKIVDHRMHDGRSYTLVRWITVRRDAEWVSSSIVPVLGVGISLDAIINSIGKAP